MAHYAKVLEGKVVNVMVAEGDLFDTFVDTTAGEWIKTSYNTHAGEHLTGGTPLRKNYAAVGFTYDRALDAFIPPQLYPSWSFNSETCMWDCPVPYPEDKSKFYDWDEENRIWIVVE